MTSKQTDSSKDSSKADRRGFLATAAAVACSHSLDRLDATNQQSTADDESSELSGSPIRYCLNTSTIRGQQLSVDQQVAVAASAGYDAIELWIPELKRFADTGSLDDLRKQIDDSGLTVESAIGFANWIIDDDAKRADALEDARRDMEMLARIGGKRIAAPPVGAHKQPGPELDVIARRYRALLELGSETGVTPQLELWGFSKTLSRLGELAYVATESGHPDACVLPDVYHIYKGGSDFNGLAMIEASRMKVFHMNDYPDSPGRDEIADADRVYPGDGVAPLEQIINTVLDGGFRGFFSLELFHPGYWELPAAEVAATGLEKMKAVVTAAMEAR